MASSRCLPPDALVTLSSSRGVWVGNRHQRLWPTTKAFHALVPRGSMWMPVPDRPANAWGRLDCFRAFIEIPWNMKEFCEFPRGFQKVYLAPSQTIDMVAYDSRQNIWIDRLGSRAAPYNRPTVFFGDCAVDHYKEKSEYFQIKWWLKRVSFKIRTSP